jgi:ribA/ribD-fused uncharacterized protein
MVKATYLKFTTSAKATPLKAQLLATGDRQIVEASSDKIWGCGLTLTKARTYKGDTWPGKNLLGQAIMLVRDRLRVEEKEKRAQKKEADEQADADVDMEDM